jgi:hypothetical protein
MEETGHGSIQVHALSARAKSIAAAIRMGDLQRQASTR